VSAPLEHKKKKKKEKGANKQTDTRKKPKKMARAGLVRFTDGRVYAARVRRIARGSFCARFSDGEWLFARRVGGEFSARPMLTALAALCDAALTECPPSPRRTAARRARRRVAG
jgi:hypothetical protein